MGQPIDVARRENVELVARVMRGESVDSAWRAIWQSQGYEHHLRDRQWQRQLVDILAEAEKLVAMQKGGG